MEFTYDELSAVNIELKTRADEAGEKGLSDEDIIGVIKKVTNKNIKSLDEVEFAEGEQKHPSQGPLFVVKRHLSTYEGRTYRRRFAPKPEVKEEKPEKEVPESKQKPTKEPAIEPVFTNEQYLLARAAIMDAVKAGPINEQGAKTYNGPTYEDLIKAIALALGWISTSRQKFTKEMYESRIPGRDRTRLFLGLQKVKDAKGTYRYYPASAGRRNILFSLGQTAEEIPEEAEVKEQAPEKPPREEVEISGPRVLLEPAPEPTKEKALQVVVSGEEEPAIRFRFTLSNVEFETPSNLSFRRGKAKVLFISPNDSFPESEKNQKGSWLEEKNILVKILSATVKNGYIVSKIGASQFTIEDISSGIFEGTIFAEFARFEF